MSILATALGKSLAKLRGLKRLQLPSPLGENFAVELVRAANNETNTPEAVIVVLEEIDAPEFISPERAAELRSRDDGQPARALVVNFTGEYREWNTLEPFRLLNPSVLPSGLVEEETGELTISQVASAIVDGLRGASQEKFKVDAAEAVRIIVQVCRYLAEAYAELGSSRAAWDHAWWSHLKAAIGTLEKIVVEGDAQYDEIEDFAVAVYAAAGMPIPARPSHGYRDRNSPREYAKAIQERWSGEGDAAVSARDLARDWITKGEDRSIDDFSLLGVLGEFNLTDSFARLGHPLLALAILGGSTPVRAQAWALVDEDAFFAQKQVEIDTALSGLGLDSQPFELLRVGEKPELHVLPVPQAEVTDDQICLGLYRISIAGEHSIDRDKIQLSCSPAVLVATHQSSPVIVDGNTVLTVSLDLKVRRTLATWRESPYRIDLTLKADELGEPAQSTTPLFVYVPMPGATSALVYENRKQGGDGRRIVPPLRNCSLANGEIVLGNCDDGNREVQTPAKVTRVNIYAVGPAPKPLSTAEWSPIPMPAGEAVEALAVIVADGIEIASEGDCVRITPDEQVEKPISPILAAAMDTVAADDPGEEDAFKETADPRCLIEAWQAEKFVLGSLDDELRRSLGQVHFALDKQGADSDQIIRHSSGLFTLGHLEPIAKLPADIGEQEQVARFWQAFESLGLKNLCSGREAPNSGWPSKLDLRDLPEVKVTAYLEAYVELLGLAKLGLAYRGLAYPFSCVAFSKDQGLVRGALLTALHPVRLAWNWAAQHAAKNAADQIDVSDAVNLLRFMDGSELPCSGPPLSIGEPYIATPVSPGLGSAFATWQFLAVAGALAGDSAPRMGGRAFPAGAISGLNADSVGAAIRDYLRVNPFVTSLDVGLYTIKAKTRSVELDEAVVGQLDPLLSGEVGNLPGGLQIVDSSKREGNPPARQQVLAKVTAAQQKRQVSGMHGDRLTVPFSWISSSSNERDVDLRFLEDSIVSLSVETDSSEISGASVVPTLPVARRNLWEHPENAPAVSHATLGEHSGRGLRGFSEAVDAFERLTKEEGEAIKRIAAIPHAATLMDRKARWLVAGNMNLDPRTLSSALKDMQTGAVLWEWRPPYMERRSSDWAAILPARPYAVIANPNQDFLDQVGECILQVAGKECSTSSAAIMSELGTRGVGLASLLSMGHQQSRGAIGFYLAFYLLGKWEQGATDDSVRMVLPLDAVNPVLQLLAGQEGGDATRKADLLLLEGSRTGDSFKLSLRPVEIKMHAAQGATPHAFPSLTSSPVKDAVEQLAHTRKLLGELEERMTRVSDVPLLQSALLALLETSLSLSTTTSDSVSRELMSAAANGNVELVSAPGILLWFDAGASKDDLPYEQGLSDAQDQILMVDPRAVLATETQHDRNAISVLLNTMLGPVAVEDRLSEPPAEDDDEQAEIAVSEQVDLVGKGAGNESEIMGDDNVPKDSLSPGELLEQIVNAQPIDELADGMPVQVGWTKEGLSEEPLMFDPRDTRINQLNMGVVGDLGTGKTQFLKSLVYQLTRPNDSQDVPPKAFIFDYKKDYVDPDFVRLTGSRVLDPSKTPIPLNFFALEADAGKFEVASRALLFADTVDKIYAIGPNQHQALRTAVLNAYAENGSPMLSDVLANYQDIVSSNDSVTSALSLMVDFDLFESNAEKLQDFDTLFEKSVVLALGNIASAGTQVQNMLVTLFLNLLHVEYMKKRLKFAPIKGADGITRRYIDSFILVDEAHNIMGYEFESLQKLLLEGREFGMGVILSSQYLSHFKTKKTNWIEPLLTWAIHKVPNVTPAELNKLGLKKDLEAICDRISSLEVHRSFFKSPVGKARDGVWLREKPFFEFLGH